MTSMEAPECLQGGRGTPHCAPEKAAGGDHFVVEDLLDFSNGGEEDDDWGFDAAAANSADDSSTVTAVECCSNSSSSRREPHFGCEPAFRSFDNACLSGDLCGPHEELAELEWLSNFVEESFSGEDGHRPQLVSGTNPTTSLSSYADAAAAQPPRAPVLAKARSKRSRPAPCSWSSRVLVFSPSRPPPRRPSWSSSCPRAPPRESRQRSRPRPPWLRRPGRAGGASTVRRRRRPSGGRDRWGPRRCATPAGSAINRAAWCQSTARRPAPRSCPPSTPTPTGRCSSYDTTSCRSSRSSSRSSSYSCTTEVPPLPMATASCTATWAATSDRSRDDVRQMNY
ncbi:unnamed protein product [Musa textilis]